jgi:hypothetical protein
MSNNILLQHSHHVVGHCRVAKEEQSGNTLKQRTLLSSWELALSDKLELGN